jgi:probable phosphoglycerate mutase
VEVVLVRHGEPVIAQSEDAPVDPELTERGLWQAERLGDWLACEGIDHIVASTKRRAQETAAPLARRLGLEVEIVADIDEIDRVSKVYAPFGILQERFPDYWDAVQRGDWQAIGWDDPAYFRDRVLAAWNTLIERAPGDRIVIACHGGVIGVIAAHVIGHEKFFALGRAPFASCSRVVVDSGSAQMVSLNEIAHFDASRDRVVGPDGEGFDAP